MGESSPLAHSPTLASQPPGDDRQLVAGAKVGDYVIERFIGGGAMGEVYAGKHPLIGKRVAIKVLRHELAASAEAAERFIREARAVNQIEHENVIDVFAFGRLDDGQLYLVMDLVEGRSLRAHLVDGPLELGTALDILDTIADALDAAHSKGVVHRDLKPDNIVLSSATPPKVFVLDFGIAKLVSKANEGDGAKPGTLTGQGTWLGTPGYMAPEQWSVDGAGPASDRYALGVIAFELLTGSPPFSATSAPGMMEQHFRAKVPALSSRGVIGIPASVDAVLERAMAKDPEERYPTAREMVAALRDAAGTGAHRARGAIERPASQMKMLMPALAGAGVLGLGIIAFVATRGHDKAHSPGVADTVEDPKAHTGEVQFDLISSPSGAQVKTDHVIGVTPTKLMLKPGAEVVVTVAKPGYLAAKQSIVAGPQGRVVQLSLSEVAGFNGVWKLGDGQLRALERSGDQVAIYKVKEIDGPREFFKNYAFTAAESGVAFANDDEIVDPRKPSDPHCHVPVHTEYQYDPANDALVVKLDKVEIDLVDGSCVVRSRRVISDTLVHVDHPNDTVEIPAPVGIPEPTKSPKKKTIVPLDPQTKLDSAKKADEFAKLKTVRKQPNVGKTSPVSDKSAFDAGSLSKNPPNADPGAQYNVGSKDSQIAPQPALNAPMANAEPPAQQVQKPQTQAPSQADQAQAPQQQALPQRQKK